MQKFITKHEDNITGVLSCPDRIIFKGYLPMRWPKGMEIFMANRGVLLKDFKTFVLQHSNRVKEHAVQMAEREGRPYLYLYSQNERKEDRAREIAEEDGVKEGLVCIFSTVEPCQSFVLRYGKKRPRLEWAARKCLCLYFYFIDRELGFMHVRIQTWFPFTIQIYVNGHDWLARKLDRHGIKYKQQDNVFLWIEDFRKAQRFSDNFIKKRFHRLLDVFAFRVNPLVKDILKDKQYYWVISQYEYSTDILFQDHESLKELYPKLLEHATVCFSAEDVLSFLGKKLHGNFKGEVLNDFKKRIMGTRIKHRMKDNWIKMYDKQGLVLRIETVINHPYGFMVRRRGIRKGKTVLGWFPMAKGVSNFRRFAEVCWKANHRYLQALSAVDDPSQAYHLLERLCEPAKIHGRRRRGINPLRKDDLLLFRSVMKGQHAIHGFRNRDLIEQLFPRPTEDPVLIRRRSARVTRLIQLLRAHGLIAKIPRARRYRLTFIGVQIMSAVIYLRQKRLPERLYSNAA